MNEGVYGKVLRVRFQDVAGEGVRRRVGIWFAPTWVLVWYRYE